MVMAERLFGAEHTNTLNSVVNDLASTYENQER